MAAPHEPLAHEPLPQSRREILEGVSLLGRADLAQVIDVTLYLRPDALVARCEAGDAEAGDAEAGDVEAGNAEGGAAAPDVQRAWVDEPLEDEARTRSRQSPASRTYLEAAE